jgi:hypothetical protein
VTGRHEGSGSFRRDLTEVTSVVLSILALLGFLFSMVFIHRVWMVWLWGATAMVGVSQMLGDRRGADFRTWGSLSVACALSIISIAVRSWRGPVVLSVCLTALAGIVFGWSLWNSARRISAVETRRQD